MAYKIGFFRYGICKHEFEDYYSKKCSLQESSATSSECIWLGIEDAEPVIMASRAKELGLPSGDGTGWVDYPVDQGVLINTRMHLTREQVADLLPSLQYFVDTGSLPRVSDIVYKKPLLFSFTDELVCVYNRIKRLFARNNDQ